MRSKSPLLMNKIIEYIDNHYSKNGTTPTVRDIGDALNISKSSVSDYLNVMKDKGMLENNGCRGVRTKTMTKMIQGIEQIPVIGSIACGNLLFAEENIESYIPVPKDFLGSGKHFFLKATGNSMINAGIVDGDWVLFRQQDTADEGQIVIARVDNEATLKRYYLDKKRKKVRLHPENDEMEDMLFDSINIQGIAVKVIKNLI